MGNITTHELATILAEIEQALPGAASRNPKLGFKKAREFLSRSENCKVSDLIAGLEKQKSEAPKRRSGARSPVATNREVVASFVEKLTSSLNDKSVYETILIEMRRAKNVRIAELKLIVSGITGNTSSFKGWDAGLGILREFFDRNWKLQNR